VLVEAAPGDTDNTQFNAVLGEIVADLRALDVVASAVSYLDEVPLLSSDGTKALMQLTTTHTEDDDLAPADTILELIAEASANSGLRVTSIGTISVNTVFAEMIEETFAKGEVIGIVAALFIIGGCSAPSSPRSCPSCSPSLPSSAPVASSQPYDETHDHSASVVYGLHSTATIITGAALIMVAVFGGFALGSLSMFQQMGFGLAVAVILDSTVIRMVLVPASMELLGDRNWYFPSRLEWLPKISIEGNHERPAPAPTPAGASDD